jgi:hypothetical protein
MWIGILLAVVVVCAAIYLLSGITYLTFGR